MYTIEKHLSTTIRNFHFIIDDTMYEISLHYEREIQENRMDYFTSNQFRFRTKIFITFAKLWETCR